MKCVIPGLNMKLFSRAIHSLARIGDELYVEPSNDGVSFRTVDSSRSAFGSFFFKSSFFSLFDFKPAETGSEEESFKCKVAMKACLNAFKSVNNIEKSVEKCRLIVDPDEDRLIVNMICRHGINKTYNLSFIECETLHADFDRATCHFSVTSQSRFLCDAFINFHSNQEEVTLSFTPQRTIIRNYVDDEPDPTKAIHTEFSVESEEFEQYKVDEFCEITFSLKEARSLLTFSEPVNLPVSFYFTRPGSPIIFVVENLPMFEANFVLATLSPTIPHSQQSNQGNDRCAENSNTKISTSESFQEEICRNSMKRPSEAIAEVSSRLNCTSKLTSNETFRNKEHSFSGSRSPKFFNKRSSFQNSSQISVPTVNLESPATSKQEFNCTKSRNNMFLANPDRLTSNGNNSFGDANQTVVFDSDEDMEIPGTPPAKRRRFFFKRCFEPTFHAENISQFNRILAEDSDGET